MDEEGMIPWRPASSHFFEITPKQRREELLLQPFLDEQKRQETVRKAHLRKNSEATCQMQDQRRMLIYQTFREHLQKRRLKEFYDFAMHALVQNSWHCMEQKDYATEAEISEKTSKQQVLEMEEERSTFEEELKLFERKGFELGAETITEGPQEIVSKDRLIEKGKEKRKEFNKASKDTKGLKRLKLEDSLESTIFPQDSRDYLAEVKQRVLRAENQKKELQQRIELELFETQQKEKEMEACTKQTKDDDVILKSCEEEIHSSEQVQTIESEEQDKIEFRLELEKHILEQRNHEWEAVLAHDRELLLMMRHDRADEFDYEQQLWQEEKEQKIERKQLKHEHLCHEVLLQIATLAESCVIYKVSTNSVLSITEWWEWKNLFIKGAVHPFSLRDLPLTLDMLTEEADEVIEQTATREYLQGCGEWKGKEIIGTNKELGKIVYDLFTTSENIVRSTPPPFLSHMQLKLAVVGTPFAGKSALARLLEDRFGVIRIEIDSVIASAIATVESEEPGKTQIDGDNQEQRLDEIKAVNDEKRSIPFPNPNVLNFEFGKNEDYCSTLGSSLQRTSEQTFLQELELSQEKDPLVQNQREHVPSKISLCRQARDALSKGMQVPDEVAIHLLLLTLGCLDDYDTISQSASPKGQKRKDETIKQESPRPKQKEVLDSSQKTSKLLNLQKNGSKEKTILCSSEEADQRRKRGTIGFVLDGYPTTKRQAEILQRGLCGCGLYTDLNNKTSYVSLIAPPPELDQRIRPEYPLDAVFLLEPLDEGCALNQALGKCIDSKTGISYHLEYDPPPPNDRTGIMGRLKRVEEVGAARKRITEGTQIWKSLFKWINTFSNAYIVEHDEEKKLKSEDPCTVVQGMLDTKMKILAAADAAKAAIEAKEAAFQACCVAENANFQAKEVAHKLFVSKLAEVEANSLLERSGNDSVAKEILKLKVSEVTSCKLQEAAKALKEAKESADTAQKAAKDAFHASELAQQVASSVYVINQAKEEALAAAKAAKQAASQANVASQRAQSAAESASLSLADINTSFLMSEENILKQKITALSTPSMQNSTEPNDLEMENNTKFSEADPCFAENLCKQWKEIESRYLNNLKTCIHKLCLERKEDQKLLKKDKEAFAMYLKHSDERQKLLDDFQGKYNRVDASQRSTIKMKKQLQKKAEDLVVKLQSISESYLKDAKETCENTLSNWLERRVQAISCVFTMFIQMELERFTHTCCLLYEYYFKISSLSIKDKFSDATNFCTPISKQTKISCLPGWLPSVADCLPQLHQVLENAILTANNTFKASSEPERKNQNLAGPKVALTSPKKIVETIDKRETLAMEKIRGPIIKVLQDEFQILVSRFEILASKACNHVNQLDVLREGARNRMEEWMNRSFKGKLDIIEEVINIVQEAIEESIPLWYYIDLKGEHLYIDESQLLLDPPLPLGLLTLPDLTNWHYRVLEELVTSFQADCPKGYVPLVKASEAVHHAVESVHGACKNDLTSSLVPRVPATKSRPGGPFEVWKDYTKEMIKVSTEDRSENAVKMIDWRSFLISLTNAHYGNYISSATLEDILHAHISLKEASEGYTGYISLAQLLDTRLWFDSESKDTEFNVGMSLKKIFYSMLNDERGMPWKSLLLYLCKSSDLEVALHKAHAAISGTSSVKLYFRPEELLQALYPCGMEGAVDQGFQTWSLEDFNKLMEDLQHQWMQKKHSVTGGIDPEECQESNPDTCQKSTGAHRGSGLSDQTNITVKDFLAPTADEQETHNHPSIDDTVLSRCSGSALNNEMVNTLNNHGQRVFPGIANRERSENTSDEVLEGPQVAEHAAATMKDFLAACDSVSELKSEEHVLIGEENGRQGENLAFSLDDLLRTDAASNLTSALRSRFGSKSLFVMPCIDKTK